MFSPILEIALACLAIVLGILLVLRHRQLKLAVPVRDLQSVLKGLEVSLVAGRTEGKIQTVACQLSDILANYLQSDRILFFRRQRRFMELNYVFGMKNIRRTHYRIKLSGGLIKHLTGGAILPRPLEMRELWGEELSRLLETERFTLAFPIFWMDNLFGVYFIRTTLATEHPIVQTFLLFLNQNLSAVYQIQRLEAARQVLEQQVETSQKRLAQFESSTGQARERDEYPGHLIEMFNCRRVDDLVTNLFDKVKAGLRADRLVFVSPRAGGSDAGLQYAFGMNPDSISLDGPEFDRIFGRLQRQQVYELAHLANVPGGDDLRSRLEKAHIGNFAVFSLGEDEPGLLFWTGRGTPDQGGNRLLVRLEKVAQKALTNAREFERVEAMSYTDSLTGLNNYRYFIKRLSEETQRAKRYHRRLGLLLFDIDDFKLFNDRFGHQFGDTLLRRMGAMLIRTLRSIDIVSRYGGDEFCIIMPEADRATCVASMERLRDSIGGNDFNDPAAGFEGQLTISIGSAVFPDDADSDERLIYCADMALLQSKALGRNRGTLFEQIHLK